MLDLLVNLNCSIFTNLSFCGVFFLGIVYASLANTEIASPAYAKQALQYQAKPGTRTLIAAEPATNWVRVRSSITLSQLADQLDLSPELLSDSNGLPLAHRLRPDDLVALPVLSRQTLAQVRSLDSRDIRLSAPARNPLATIAKFASEASPLQVTSRLMAPAAARGRLPLAILPGGNGGLSWAVLPLLPKQKSEINTSKYTPPEIAEPQRASAQDCIAADEYQLQASVAKTNFLRRLALQRSQSAMVRCNQSRTSLDRLIAASELAEEQELRSSWRTYGDVMIPWGMWKEVAPDKRPNGFLRTSTDTSSGLGTESSSIKSLVNLTGDSGDTPNGISISCKSATYSLNVSDRDARSWKLRSHA